jgi:hypothetical protein
MIGFENFSIGTWLTEGLVVRPAIRTRNLVRVRRGSQWTSRLVVPVLAAFAGLTVNSRLETVKAMNLNWRLPTFGAHSWKSNHQAQSPVSGVVSDAATLLKSLAFIPINPADDAVVDRLVNNRLERTESRVISVRR